MTYSFDIFDTCLVRKCGTPQNMLDVLSMRVFTRPVEEYVRQSFVAARKKAEDSLWNTNPNAKLSDIYSEMEFAHSELYPKMKLAQIEFDLERELLVPVLKMRDRIDLIRSKGHHIIYISDMYLPEAFIREVMNSFGFLSLEDSLYVSCEIGRQKSDGSLFKYVGKNENLDVKKWKHTGDNRHSDYFIPHQLGIRAELIRWKYNPYPQRWLDTDYCIGYKYKSIMAGLCRALSLSNPENSHRDFVLDVVAPVYVPWVWQILERARNDGVKRLFFCARDAYQIHKIALCMQPYFPEIEEIEYLYISREALYNEENESSKLAYFVNVGLASHDMPVAIVDITTSGMTLKYLNQFLSRCGYREVRGYFYLLWNEKQGYDSSLLYPMMLDSYIKHNRNVDILQNGKYVWIFENFFALNRDRKTVDYVDCKPFFAGNLQNEEVYVDSQIDWSPIHRGLFEQYAISFCSLGLGHHSVECFEQIAIPSLCHFLALPNRCYLNAFENVMLVRKDNVILPFIKKHTFFHLFVHRKRDYVWREGTISYSIPLWMVQIGRSIISTMRSVYLMII